MKRVCLAFAALALAILPNTQAHASAVVARIDLSSQRMDVYVNGQHQHSWSVSTARKGYVTPTGSYRPYMLSKDHRSSRYDDAPMPHSVFFRGHYAIHGTNATGRLGRPASHGCVRLAPGNARTLFHLVQQHGMSQSRVVIQH